MNACFFLLLSLSSLVAICAARPSFTNNEDDSLITNCFYSVIDRTLKCKTGELQKTCRVHKTEFALDFKKYAIGTTLRSGEGMRVAWNRLYPRKVQQSGNKVWLNFNAYRGRRFSIHTADKDLHEGFLVKDSLCWAELNAVINQASVDARISVEPIDIETSEDTRRDVDEVERVKILGYLHIIDQD